MKKAWGKLSILAQYYSLSMASFFLCWAILTILNTEFINSLFFTMSFVWHFTLMTPGLKDKMLTKNQKFSFINVVVRINYYLQIFIRIKKTTFSPAIVRAISPMIFTLFLMIVGGSGNALFTLLGSVCFELSHYLLTNKYLSKITLRPPVDQEIPPELPNAENFHE
jgi:hypothetical protein